MNVDLENIDINNGNQLSSLINKYLQATQQIRTNLALDMENENDNINSNEHELNDSNETIAGVEDEEGEVQQIKFDRNIFL